jgi:transglutaminase-like putative cysteine protease
MEDPVMRRAVPLPFAVLAGLLLGGPLLAADFPPVTERERALTAVAGEPNAPAVVLFKKSEFLMMGYGHQGAISSSLLVKVRTKILTEEGRSRGEVSVAHSDFVRFQGFQGRTVLADGRVLPLPADAKFERKTSARQKRSVTSVAFPGVEVGAILDYQYELRFDSPYYLEPWYFSDEVPVVYSEVIFKVPAALQAKAWSSDPFKAGLQTEMRKTSNGTEVRVWAENLPSVPDEPFGLPFADMATQMMLLPTVYSDATVHQPLLESWESICKLVDEEYQKALRKDGDAVKTAREVSAGGKDARQKAEAIYRFVRDEVATEDLTGIWLDEGSTVGRTLADRKGDYAEKALLLQKMLEAARIDARPVWAADRWRGQIDPELANPAWFDRVLVAAEIDGQRVFLDPSDRALGFGQLRYGYEGTPAVIHDRKKPETVVLPEAPFDQNARRAVIDLTLNEDGALAGTGELVLTGAHAWERIDWQDDDARTLEAWKKWLDEQYEGFAVSEVKFEERPDERKVQLTWKLAQREEDVLGDEASLVPSRPLGPVAQPLVQAGDKRRSQVLFAYPDRDEVELRLHWPEGWRVDTLPGLAKQEKPAGSFVVEVEEKEADRSLVYRRRFDLRSRKLGSSKEYEAVRALYAAVEKSDAQPLALVRR